MDKDETILDEELDEEPEEDTEDIEDDATDEEGEDDEFEYDEDGNIIIPDVVDDEEGEEDDEDATEDAEDGESENSNKGEKAAEPDNVQDEKSARILHLETELLKFRSQAKETLSKLGVKSDNVMEGLVSLAAEADGITPQEYLQKKTATEQDAKARALLQQQEFEKLAAADLAVLHASYPDTQKYKHISELPDEIRKKFGRFRDAGLSAKEAYAAANPDGIRTQVATAVKKKSLHDSKSHLRTAVPVGSKDDGIVMPKSEMARWRELFPDMSDKEIRSLYKSTAN